MNKKDCNTKHICMVSEFCLPYYYGGGEFRHYFLIKELLNRGHRVNLVCMKFKNNAGEVVSNELFGGINITHIGPTIFNPPFRSVFNHIHYLFAVFWYLVRTKYDVVDAQAFLPLIPAFIYSKITGRKMIATIHDISDGENDQWVQHRRLASFIECFIFKLPYETILVGTSSIKKRLMSKFNISSSKIKVVNHGIPLRFIDNLSPKYSINKPYKKKRNSVCYVGRFVDNKRISDLIEAISILTPKIQNIHLTIIGTGPKEWALRDHVKRLNLSKKVTFKVGIDDPLKFKILKENSICVLPSVREGFGLVLAEAMACETAVIGSDIDGICDVISDNADGLLFESGNVTDLSDKLLLLLSNDDTRKRLVMNARKKVIRRFQWKNNVINIERAYFQK